MLRWLQLTFCLIGLHWDKPRHYGFNFKCRTCGRWSSAFKGWRGTDE